MTATATRTTGVLLVGVGGQGIILASDVLAQVAMEAGLDAKKSEVHGMSQRGGTVSSHVRFGEKVWSPMIPEGGADLLMAFELAEGLRAVHDLTPGGRALVSTQRIIPPIAAGKQFSYPDDALAQLGARCKDLVSFDAQAECRALGNEKMVSVLFLGAVAPSLPFEEALWRKVIFGRVPRGTEEGNWGAFQRGRALAGA
ncbi:MAG: indolepyruvate oxidoreductase subunit beta [Candidatus Latescibacteria bacterium]|nr:indolepyruvate oxidoreductase subunit beta [Candidatus Latescibacterota bacterium]MCB9515702.1 indolepyruvate oxidoreductase subunit beta [Candidatus Latescibacterota bacterium]